MVTFYNSDNVFSFLDIFLIFFIYSTTCVIRTRIFFHGVSFQANVLHDKSHYLHPFKKRNTAILTLIHLDLIQKDMRYAKNICISSVTDIFYRKEI